MKKIPAILLFAILMVNVAGFYVYYIVTLQRIHTEMRAKLRVVPDESLTRLVMSRDEYSKSLVEDDEIKFRGKMFDVARIQSDADSVIVYGMHDEKEDDLLAFVNEVISKPFDRDSNVTGSVLQFIAMQFLPGQFIHSFLTEGDIIAHNSNYFFVSATPLLYNEAPPPRA